MQLTVKTPAKINLTLDVTGKLENGYHTLSMIMQSIDICDELSFEKIDADEIKQGIEILADGSEKVADEINKRKDK